MKSVIAALVFAAALGAHTSAHAQRIVETPLVAGWGFARCTTVASVADDPSTRTTIGQWALGYYSGLLALDVEGAAPAFRGLDAWLRSRAGNDVSAPIAERIIAECEAARELSVEVASQRVAMALAAEARQ